MNILLFTTHFNCGGITAYTLSLARMLKQRGINVWVASAGGEMLPLLNSYGIEHLYVDIKTKSELSPKVIPAIISVLNYAAEHDIDIIHAQTRVTQVVSYFVSKLNRISFVSTCHGFFKVKWGRKIFPCWGEKVFAISNAVREHLVNDFKIKKEKVKLITNGVDVEKFSREFNRDEIGQNKEQISIDRRARFVVGIIARLSSVKGHKYLLEAAAIILSKINDVYFLIIGDGEEKYNLIQQTKNLRIEKNVVFLPTLFNTLEPLKVMDVFVLPSLQEGLGLAAMEASAAGVPVVASNVGGIYSIIKDGKTGFLVEPRNPEILAEKIMLLLNDEKLRQSFAESGKQFMREKFSLKEMSDNVIKTYEELLQ
ncbi:MAG: glycosyltransferase family 4 protein [Candidatus Omnitrophota bacterium]